jgi:hypothetical protein
MEEARKGEAVTAEVGRPSAVDPGKAASAEEMQTPLASPSSLPPESPAKELFSTGRDRVPPGAGLVEKQEAGRGVAHQTAESTEVSYCLLAV